VLPQLPQPFSARSSIRSSSTRARRLRGDFISDPCAEQQRSTKPSKERGRRRVFHLDFKLARKRAAVLLHQHRDDLLLVRLAHHREYSASFAAESCAFTTLARLLLAFARSSGRLR